MRLIYLLFTVVVVALAIPASAQCEEGKDAITGQKLMFGKINIRGDREYWVLSRTDNGFLFSYHNKDKTDRNYTMPSNNEFRFVTKDSVIRHATSVSHRALPENGFSFWGSIHHEDLKSMMYLSQIEIDLPDETRVVTISKAKLIDVRALINCLY